MWSEPRRVSERILNSYRLETLNGQPLDGEYHARRLRKFILREGTELAAQQREIKMKEAEVDKETETEEDPEEKHDEEGIEENNDEPLEESTETAIDRRGRLQN